MTSNSQSKNNLESSIASFNRFSSKSNNSDVLPYTKMGQTSVHTYSNNTSFNSTSISTDLVTIRYNTIENAKHFSSDSRNENGNNNEGEDDNTNTLKDETSRNTLNTSTRKVVIREEPECICCYDLLELHELAQPPCRHCDVQMCTNCLQRQYKIAEKDEVLECKCPNPYCKKVLDADCFVTDKDKISAWVKKCFQPQHPLSYMFHNYVEFDLDEIVNIIYRARNESFKILRRKSSIWEKEKHELSLVPQMELNQVPHLILRRTESQDDINIHAKCRATRSRSLPFAGQRTYYFGDGPTEPVNENVLLNRLEDLNDLSLCASSKAYARNSRIGNEYEMPNLKTIIDTDNSNDAFPLSVRSLPGRSLLQSFPSIGSVENSTTQTYTEFSVESSNNPHLFSTPSMHSVSPRRGRSRKRKKRKMLRKFSFKKMIQGAKSASPRQKSPRSMNAANKSNRNEIKTENGNGNLRIETQLAQDKEQNFFSFSKMLQFGKKRKKRKNSKLNFNNNSSLPLPMPGNNALRRKRSASQEQIHRKQMNALTVSQKELNLISKSNPSSARSRPLSPPKKYQPIHWNDKECRHSPISDDSTELPPIMPPPMQLKNAYNSAPISFSLNTLAHMHSTDEEKFFNTSTDEDFELPQHSPATMIMVGTEHYRRMYKTLVKNNINMNSSANSENENERNNKLRVVTDAYKTITIHPHPSTLIPTLTPSINTPSALSELSEDNRSYPEIEPIIDIKLSPLKFIPGTALTPIDSGEVYLTTDKPINSDSRESIENTPGEVKGDAEAEEKESGVEVDENEHEHEHDNSQLVVGSSSNSHRISKPRTITISDDTFCLGFEGRKTLSCDYSSNIDPNMNTNTNTNTNTNSRNTVCDLDGISTDRDSFGRDGDSNSRTTYLSDTITKRNTNTNSILFENIDTENAKTNSNIVINVVPVADKLDEEQDKSQHKNQDQQQEKVETERTIIVFKENNNGAELFDKQPVLPKHASSSKSSDMSSQLHKSLALLQKQRQRQASFDHDCLETDSEMEPKARDNTNNTSKTPSPASYPCDHSVTNISKPVTIPPFIPELEGQVSESLHTPSTPQSLSRTGDHQLTVAIHYNLQTIQNNSLEQNIRIHSFSPCMSTPPCSNDPYTNNTYTNTTGCSCCVL